MQDLSFAKKVLVGYYSWKIGSLRLRSSLRLPILT